MGDTVSDLSHNERSTFCHASSRRMMFTHPVSLRCVSVHAFSRFVTQDRCDIVTFQAFLCVERAHPCILSRVCYDNALEFCPGSTVIRRRNPS